MFHHDLGFESGHLEDLRQLKVGSGTTMVYTNNVHTNTVSNVAYSRQSKLIYTGSIEGSVGT